MSETTTMYDVLCLGITVMDVVAIPVPKPEDWKEKQQVEEIRINVGGDAANQAFRLSDRGKKVVLVGSVGNDYNGMTLKAQADSKGICTDYLAVKEDKTTTTSIVFVDADGERHTFSRAGAHMELCREDLNEARNLRKRAVSLGSLFSMPLLESDGLTDFLKECAQKGETVFADLGSDKKKQGFAGVKDFLPYIDYFMPSEKDALAMTNTETPEAAADFFRKNGAKTVVIKCGARGCFFLADRGSGWVAAPKVQPVDTTGAGDTMVALFIDRILDGDPLREALAKACDGASKSTLYVGANAGLV